MKRERRSFTKEFKLEAIRLAETSGKAVSRLEKELGLSSGLLRLWLRQYREEGDVALLGKGAQDAERVRVRELERELAVVRQERDILKKAVSIFSQASE